MNSITSQKRASVGYESLLVPGGFDCHLQTGESMEEDPVSRDPPHASPGPSQNSDIKDLKLF